MNVSGLQVHAVRQLEHSDLDAVVRLHEKAFPNFFLSFLGEKFLKEFYGAFVGRARALAFVSEDASGQVRGVVVGTSNPSHFFRQLLCRRWWAFSVASVWAVMRRPSIASRLMRAVTYRGESPVGGGCALLSSIAVDPTAQGQGIGRALVLRWVEEMRVRGVKGCYLTTDADNNDAVNAFYQGLGWKLESRSTTREGRRMNRYVYGFPEASAQ